jgi:hypothetical protein
MKDMLFNEKGVCFGRVDEFCNQIRKEYVKLTRKQEGLIDFFYNEYPDAPGVLFSRYCD